MSDVQMLIRHAATMWTHSRDAISAEGRVEFGRLALLYERMAVRVARRDLRSSTLGDLLYGDKSKHRITEGEWVSLVRAVARRDQDAFQTLYLWTHRLIITLIMGITDDWFATEALTVDVFDDVWQGAGRFDPLGDTVIGWIMNLARSRAVEGVCENEGPGRKESSAATRVFEVMVDRLTDALPFSVSLWSRITGRITMEANDHPLPTACASEREEAWEQPVPGISCKILATESQRGRISMLVRLAPGMEYPPHIHMGVEELHMLQGELCIDDRRLHRGDHNRSEPGTADGRVWSQTGCTCILVASSRDIIS